MAKAQSNDAQGSKKLGLKGKRLWIVIGAVVLLLAGVVAGAGIWRAQQGPSAPSERVVDAASADKTQALLPIGRMTVNISAAGALNERQSRYLVIEPTLLYMAAFNESSEQKMDTYQAALRDSFIEYLSQLHENDVYGSAGLAKLRAELLRRARLVTNSDAPLTILLQDFVLQ